MDALASEGDAAVRVWLERVDTPLEPDDIAILDTEERARADRFRFERDYRRFVARRAFLRRVLAGYTGVAPAALRYRRSANGKPELQDVDGLAFSTSHAAGLAAVAVATHANVGIDVERLRPMPDALDIARRFFTGSEVDHLRAVPAARRSDAFLRLWTRKEAYVKALGRGLSMPLDGFEALAPEARVVGEIMGSETGPGLLLTGLELPDGFLGHVAADADALVRQAAPLAMAS